MNNQKYEEKNLYFSDEKHNTTRAFNICAHCGNSCVVKMKKEKRER
jgi:hypothetical protein